MRLRLRIVELEVAIKLGLSKLNTAFPLVDFNSFTFAFTISVGMPAPFESELIVHYASDRLPEATIAWLNRLMIKTIVPEITKPMFRDLLQSMDLSMNLGDFYVLWRYELVVQLHVLLVLIQVAMMRRFERITLTHASSSSSSIWTTTTFLRREFSIPRMRKKPMSYGILSGSM